MDSSQKEDNKTFVSKLIWIFKLSSEKKFLLILCGFLIMAIAILTLPSLNSLFSERILLWILCGLLVLTGVFKNSSSGSAMVIGLGVVVLTYALIDISTLKKLTSPWVSWERYIATETDVLMSIQWTKLNTKERHKADPKEIERLIEKARYRSDDKRSPEDYLLLAGEAWKQKKYEDGLQLAYVGLQLQPKDNRTRAGLYNGLARIYHDLKIYGLAKRNYLQAVQSYANYMPLILMYADTHISLGVLYLEGGDFNQAMEEYFEALKINPNSILAHYNLGVIYEKLNKPNLAEAEYKKALDIDPNYAKARYNLGVRYKARKEFNLAEAEYKKALDVDPNYAQPHFGLGKLYVERGYPNLAEAEYKKALDKNPEYSEVYYKLGDLYKSQGRFEEADNMYLEALRRLPKQIEIYFGLGELYIKQGKKDKAEKVFSKALELDLDSKRAQEILEKLIKLRGGDKGLPDHPTFNLSKEKNETSQ